VLENMLSIAQSRSDRRMRCSRACGSGDGRQMPLSSTLPHAEVHLRCIELRGYRRHDRRYDIEARTIDTKAQELTLECRRIVPPGGPWHDMSIRLVADGNLDATDIVASTHISLRVGRPQCANALRVGLEGAFHRSAYFVDRILKGAKPAELPIEQPTAFQLVLHQRTARSLGLRFPQLLLLRADEVIQW
jgi:hypothetical protein